MESDDKLRCLDRARLPRKALPIVKAPKLSVLGNTLPGPRVLQTFAVRFTNEKSNRYVCVFGIRTSIFAFSMTCSSIVLVVLRTRI